MIKNLPLYPIEYAEKSDWILATIWNRCQTWKVEAQGGVICMVEILRCYPLCISFRWLCHQRRYPLVKTRTNLWSSCQKVSGFIEWGDEICSRRKIFRFILPLWPIKIPELEWIALLLVRFVVNSACSLDSHPATTIYYVRWRNFSASVRFET